MDMQAQPPEELDVTRSKAIRQAEHAQAFWSLVWDQFKTHTAAVVGLVIIGLLVLTALAAPLISYFTGLDPETQNALNRYLKPMAVSTLSTETREELTIQFAQDYPEAAAQLREEITAKNLVPPPLAEEPAAPIEGTPPAVEGEAPPTHDVLTELVKQEPEEMLAKIKSLESKGSGKFKLLAKRFQTKHVFGTDELGRDVLIRLIYGARVSMGVGILVALASALIGLLIGAMAGYYGGVIDTFLMRLTDTLLSLPTMPILIVVSAISVDKVPGLRSLITESNENIMKLVFIFVLFSWMTVARLVRAEVLSLREREFVLAARTLGARDFTILFKHLFPNVIAPLLVSVTLGIGESIQYEAALSFLGLGIQQPTPSWGNMLFNAQDLITEAPFLALIPGLLILTITISFNYLGDGLQDAINPKSVRR